MRTLVQAAALAASAALVVVGCGRKSEDSAAEPAGGPKVVNVFNWSDYIDRRSLQKFTAETGIKVRYDVFDSNDVLETKLLAGNSGFDVVVPSA